MPYKIVKQGDKYCVVKKDGGKQVGCSGTKAEALAHIRAMYFKGAKARLKTAWADKSGSDTHGREAAAAKAHEDAAHAHDYESSHAANGGEHKDIREGTKVAHELSQKAEAMSKDVRTAGVHAQNATDRSAGAVRMSGAKTLDTAKIAEAHRMAAVHHREAAALHKSQLKTSSVSFKVQAAGYELKTASHEGVEYVVVPVVGMVDGVIWPINSDMPERVPFESYAPAPMGWNGRPIFCGHPVDASGNQISAGDPTVLASAFGLVFNARVEDQKLKMDAYLDVAKCKALGGSALETLERAQAGDPIEISIGAFVRGYDEAGVWNGKPYKRVWAEVTPDHLALLPKGDVGACSRAAGCGVRAAQVHKSARPGVQYSSMNLRRILRALAEAVKAADQPAGDGPETDPNFQALTDALKAASPDQTVTIESIEPDTVIYSCETPDGIEYWQRTYQANEDGTCVLGEPQDVQEAGEVEPAENTELIDAKGARNSAKDQATLQSMHDNAVSLGATCAQAAAAKYAAENTVKTRIEKIAAIKALLACDCVAKLEANKSKSDILDAIIAQIVEKLGLDEAAGKDIAGLDEKTLLQLAGLNQPPADESANADGADVAAASDAPAAEVPVAAAAKPLTAEEWLAAAPESIRNVVADAQLKDNARRGVLVTAIAKAAKEYTADELKAMTTAQLEKLGRAVSAAAPVDVDFSVNAARVEETEQTAAPAAPDMAALIRAKRAK